MTSLTNSSTCGKDHSLTRARTPDAEEVCAGHRQAQVYAHELMHTLAHRNSITNPCTCHAHELIYNSPTNALTCEIAHELMHTLAQKNSFTNARTHLHVPPTNSCTTRPRAR